MIDEIDRSLPPKDDHVLEIHNLKLGVKSTNPGPSVLYYFWLTDADEVRRTNPPALLDDGTLNVPAIEHCIREGVRYMPGIAITIDAPPAEYALNAHGVMV